MKMTDIINHIQNDIPDAVFFQDEKDISQFTTSNTDPAGDVPPEGIVRPKTINALRDILCAANKHHANITVSSSSGNHRKGGFAAQKDHIHIDLSQWKNIPYINKRNRVCMIDPGVTYEQLLSALKPHGMTVSMPLCPRLGKSVLASVTDREPSTWPNKQWDISDPMASSEFIFGNGEIFRTGAAGGPGSLEKQRAAGGAQKCPLGPSQTDFHRVVQGAQGTMGIITWITLRTEHLPLIQKPFLLGANDLNALARFVYDVQRPGLGEHSFIMDKTATATLFSGTGQGDFSTFFDALPEYLCLQNIAGFNILPEERVAYQTEDIRKIAGKYQLELTEKIGEIHAADMLKTATTPCGEADFRTRVKGDCLSVFFLTTLDRIKELVAIYRTLAEKHGFQRKDTGVYIQPIVQNHACHVEFQTLGDPENSEQKDHIILLEREAVTALSDNRAFFSRPYGASQEIAFNRNPGNMALIKKVKEIFDPNRILNNGKWGL